MKVSRWVFWMAIATLAFGAQLRAETIRYTISEEGSEAAAAEASCDDCGSCFSCTPCCDDGGLSFSLFAPSEPCFHDFISPMTNPVYFEDPRQVSEPEPSTSRTRFPWRRVVDVSTSSRCKSAPL